MKPRILFHADNTYWAGSEQMLTCLFASQRLRDNFTLGFSLPKSERFVKTMLEWTDLAGIKHSQLPETFVHKFNSQAFYKHRWLKLLSWFYWVIDAAKILETIRDFGPDVLHVHNGGYPGALSCNAAVAAAIHHHKVSGNVRRPAVVYFVNNLPQQRSGTRERLERRIDAWNAFGVDVWMSGSHSVRKAFMNTFPFWGRAKGRWAVIPNTIHGHPLSDRGELRKGLGIWPDDIVIGSVGVFEGRKGHQYLFDAFRQIWDGRKRLFLLLVGDGPLKSELQQQAYLHFNDVLWTKMEGKDKHRKWVYINTHPPDQHYSIIDAMDIYVQPSVAHEDFPISVLQAMSLGKPIVGTSIAGLSEMLGMDVSVGCGRIVPPADSDSLHKALKELVLRSGAREIVGEAAKQRFEENYSYDVVMQQYINLYKGLV